VARGQVSVARARAILSARGFDPAAGAEALAAAIGARGWRVETERNDAGGRRAGGPVRWRALAARAGAAGEDRASLRTVSASGRSEADVLAVVLAKVLERTG
jgi:hypothetical protein